MAESRLTWPNKYSAEKIVPGIDWTPRLRLGEYLEGGTEFFEAIDGGDVICENNSLDLDNNTTYTELSGGSPNTPQWVRGIVSTNTGRQLMEICVFRILREGYPAQEAGGT